MLVSAQCAPASLVFDANPPAQSPNGFTELPPGSLIAKHYEVVSVLGVGGMGIVSEARHQLLNKTIAVKLALNTEHSTNLHRFHREAQAASRLRHTNIVTVHEFGCTDGNQFYMVMDCVEGPTLADAIRERGRLPLDQAIDIFIQLCDAVAHAHENAVLHRDLKPENILLTMSDTGQTTAHIVDFGIAKLIEPHNTLEKSLTHTGQLFGSPLYMSPEQAMGSPADARSDIYALGCIMYETLVGVPPLSGESFMSTLIKHVREIPVSLREASLGEDFPQQIETIVAKTLAKDPARRFQSAAELRQALIQFKDGASGRFAVETAPRSAKPFSIVGLSKLVAIFLVPLCIMAVLALAFLNGSAVESGNTLHAPVPAAAAHQTSVNVDEHGYGDMISRLAALTADDAFASLVNVRENEDEVTADGTAVSDKGLKYLRTAHNVQNLSLTSTKITDYGLKYVCQLPLRSLYINKTRVHGDGFSLLRNISTLEKLNIGQLSLHKGALNKLSGMRLYELYLSNDGLQDCDLDFISSLRELNALSLQEDCAITDGGVAKLKSLNQLSILYLNGTQVTGKGLSELSGLKNMKKLILEDSRGITDDAVRVVARNWQLRELDLTRNRLTGRSIGYLSKMTSLRQLGIGQCGFSQRDIEKLRVKLPHCEIHV